MGSHDPFGWLKHKLWPKEGSGFKLSIWLLTTKNQETLTSLREGGMPHTVEELLTRDTTFSSDLTSIGSLHTKLWASKVARALILGISRLPLGSLETKWHWVLVPLLGIEYIIRGKAVASSKSRTWWVLWVRVCMWFVCAPKVLRLCTIQLIVWFVQIRVNN
jgi:hypothetical protein